MKTRYLSFLLLIGLAAMSPGVAMAGPILGPALSTFAVLGGSAVTNTGTTTIGGNIGVYPGTSISGISGGAATAELAQSQLSTAMSELAGVTPVTTLASSDLTLAGTLGPGFYSVPAGTTNLSGALTLNGGGNADAAWVFLMPSSFITSSGSSVALTNTGAGAGVYWVVGSSATLGSGSTLPGNILAQDSITLGSGATVSCGRALASSGAVTMDNNTVENTCSGAEAGSNGLSGGLNVTTDSAGMPVVSLASPPPPTSAPEPPAWLLLGSGLLALGLLGSLRRKAAAVAQPAV